MDSSATNYKISWFKKEDDAEFLDLSPAFQRRPVWSEEHASYLIDTILSELPIPEVYIRSNSTAKGETYYEVVDGQQRIRSILAFGRNDLVLVGDDVSPKWLEKNFEDLTDKEKSRFWDYKIVVRDVSGASDLEIKDLFKRLNIHSVVLKDQELRHAKFTGKFIKSMEALADDEWWLESRIVNIRQVRRMDDVEFVSELFVGLIAGPQDKKKSLDEYYENFDAKMPQQSEWVQKFEQTRDLIESVLSAEEIVRWSGKSDFYTLFLAFGNLSSKKLSSTQRKEIANTLRAFRNQVDQAKKKDNKRIFPKEVHEYADAVTRAATDLGRRALRLRILEQRLISALSKKKSA